MTLLDYQCLAAQIPTPVAEHRFDLKRRFRFDYAWPEERIALEIEGAVWTRGRHTRGTGYLRDCEKYNLAACVGWIVLRVPPSAIQDGTAFAWVQKAFQWRAETRRAQARQSA